MMMIIEISVMAATSTTSTTPTVSSTFHNSASSSSSSSSSSSTTTGGLYYILSVSGLLTAILVSVFAPSSLHEHQHHKPASAMVSPLEKNENVVEDIATTASSSSRSNLGKQTSASSLSSATASPEFLPPPSPIEQHPHKEDIHQKQQQQHNLVSHSSSSSSSFIIPDNYNWEVSTENNYARLKSLSVPSFKSKSRNDDDDNDHDSSSSNTNRIIDDDSTDNNDSPASKSHSRYNRYRKRLDPTYHKYYTKERQAFQDTIIDSILGQHQQQQQQQIKEEESEKVDRVIVNNDEDDKDKNKDDYVIYKCPNLPPIVLKQHHHEPSSFPLQEEEEMEIDVDEENVGSSSQWIIFTAGVYGVGKSYMIRKLQQESCFPSTTEYIKVDPDEIRSMLPEYKVYNSKTPSIAGVQTQKESGMIAELVTDIAISHDLNVVVDGSLKDYTWYETQYFVALKTLYPQLQIGIVYVTASREDIYTRITNRNTLQTERMTRSIPIDLVQQSLIDVPESISKLSSSKYVDFFVEIPN